MKPARPVKMISFLKNGKQCNLSLWNSYIPSVMSSHTYGIYFQVACNVDSNYMHSPLADCYDLRQYTFNFRFLFPRLFLGKRSVLLGDLSHFKSRKKNVGI